MKEGATTAASEQAADVKDIATSPTSEKQKPAGWPNAAQFRERIVRDSKKDKADIESLKDAVRLPGPKVYQIRVRRSSR